MVARQVLVKMYKMEVISKMDRYIQNVCMNDPHSGMVRESQITSRNVVLVTMPDT